MDEQNTKKLEDEPLEDTKKLEDEPLEDTKKLEDEPTQKLEDEPLEDTKKLEYKPIKNLKRVEQGKRLAEWNKANKQRKNINTPQTKNVLTKNVYIVLIGILGLVGVGLFYRTTDIEPEVKPIKINVHKKDDLFEM